MRARLAIILACLASGVAWSPLARVRGRSALRAFEGEVVPLLERVAQGAFGADLPDLSAPLGESAPLLAIGATLAGAAAATPEPDATAAPRSARVAELDDAIAALQLECASITEQIA